MKRPEANKHSSHSFPFLFGWDTVSLYDSKIPFTETPHFTHCTGQAAFSWMNKIIKENGFCFVPAFKTVDKIMPCKRKDSVTDQAGLSTYWDN